MSFWNVATYFVRFSCVWIDKGFLALVTFKGSFPSMVANMSEKICINYSDIWKYLELTMEVSQCIAYVCSRIVMKWVSIDHKFSSYKICKRHECHVWRRYLHLNRSRRKGKIKFTLQIYSAFSLLWMMKISPSNMRIDRSCLFAKFMLTQVWPKFVRIRIMLGDLNCHQIM